jgi:hypothetical protein
MSRAALERTFLNKQLPYINPFFSIDYKDDNEITSWLRDTDTTLAQFNESLFREQRVNIRRFLGGGINPSYFSPYIATYWAQTSVNNDRNDININEFYRIVIDQITLIVSNELVPQVLPNNDDYDDKVSCQVVKQWLESMAYDMDMEMLRVRWEMQKKVFGESFVVPQWNPEKGPISPYAKDFNEDLDFVDDEGNPIADYAGRKVKVKKNTRIGDIDLINPLPYEVGIDPKSKFEDADWFYWKEWIDVEYLKRKYKNKVFKKDSGGRYDPFSGDIKQTPNHKCVYYFYHRSHPFLPDGRYIVATEDHVLVNESMEDLPTLIDSQELPLIRFCDLDPGFGVRGVPILFRNTGNLIDGRNRLSNQIFNNLEMESPKIMSHVNADFDAQRMPVGITVMEWAGNIEPKIITPSTNTSSIFKFREDLKQDILELALQMQTTRGQTPNAQLDSFIALQHFEDQRVQLASADIKGHIKALEKLYRMMIVIAKDKFDPEDQRLIKILGKNNSYRLKYFNPESLEKSYDVKIRSTGNLANSKAARTQLMMTIKREFPHLIQDEIFMDLLGMSNSEKFMNIVTASVSSAEAENQEMLSGNAVLEPERYEDLIVHWQQHLIPMNTLDFKVAPPEIKMLFERHVTATEKLMFELANESPTFAARLQGLKQFPIFYAPTPVNEPAPMLPGGGLPDFGGLPPEVSAPQDEGQIPPVLSPDASASEEGAPPPTLEEMEGLPNEGAVAQPT